MNMNRIQRLLTAIVVIVGLFALADAAVAAAKAANHHDAKQLLGEKIKKDGHHVIHTKGKYTSSVEVKDGKVAGVHVKHSEKGDIPVKKRRTPPIKRGASPGVDFIVYAAFVSAQEQDMGTVYIGYAFVDDDGNEEIYWFPYEMILDGDTGAVEYVPASLAAALWDPRSLHDPSVVPIDFGSGGRKFTVTFEVGG